VRRIRAADLFCGAGGTSTGLAEACKEMGRPVKLTAVNHWVRAVETHKAAHPWAEHRCASLENLRPEDAIPGGTLDLLVASPECTHHSIARGGKPKNDQSRASAWHVLKWAEHLHVREILVENVKEFLKWGPLYKKGPRKGKAIKEREGELFQAWVSALRSLGYAVEWRILNAADYGDPTTRERLFIRASLTGKIVWPEPTHSENGGGGKKKWVAARKIIDWTIEGQSIFGRKRPLCKNTIERIKAGLIKFGGPNAEPFLVLLRGTSRKRQVPYTVRSVGKPVPTISAGGGHTGVCQPFLVDVSHGKNPKGSGRGNAKRVRSVGKPVPTIAGSKSHGVCQPFIVKTSHKGGNGKYVRSVSKPLYAVTTAPSEQGVVEAFLIPFFGERKGQTPRTHSVRKPVPAVTSHGAGGLVQPQAFIITPGGANLRGGRSTKKPLPTVMCGDRLAVVSPYLVTYHSGKGRKPRVRSVGKPLPAADTSNRFAVVEPFILPHRQFRQMDVDSVKKPLRTVTAKNGNDNALVEPMVLSYYRTGTARSVRSPIPTITTKDRLGLVTVYGLDIRFRMLQPHELAAAMSFPKDYPFSGNREEQVKQIGNAVAVKVAKALCRAALLRRVA
jgi:DNA (cytosine-5)-methyltransferase 1